MTVRRSNAHWRRTLERLRDAGLKFDTHAVPGGYRDRDGAALRPVHGGTPSTARPAIGHARRSPIPPPTSQAGKRGILIRVDSGTVKALEQIALDRVATIQALGVDTRQSLLDRARG